MNPDASKDVIYCSVGEVEDEEVQRWTCVIELCKYQHL